MSDLAEPWATWATQAGVRPTMTGIGTETPEDIDLYNEGVDLSNSLLNTSPHQGAKGFELLTTPEPITSMVAPTVSASIFETYAFVKREA